MFWDNVIHGGAPEADHFAFEAGLHGLRGDRNGATTRYRTYLDQLEAALEHGAHVVEGAKATSRASKAAGVPAS